MGLSLEAAPQPWLSQGLSSQHLLGGPGVPGSRHGLQWDAGLGPDPCASPLVRASTSRAHSLARPGSSVAKGFHGCPLKQQSHPIPLNW